MCLSIRYNIIYIIHTVPRVQPELTGALVTRIIYFHFVCELNELARARGPTALVVEIIMIMIVVITHSNVRTFGHGRRTCLRRLRARGDSLRFPHNLTARRVSRNRRLATVVIVIDCTRSVYYVCTRPPGRARHSPAQTKHPSTHNRVFCK